MRSLVLIGVVLGLAASPALAQSSTNNSAKEFAPGQQQGPAKKYAPGQKQKRPGEAKKYAPGQRMHQEDNTVGRGGTGMNERNR